jgi:hypothetical protein
MSWQHFSDMVNLLSAMLANLPMFSPAEVRKKIPGNLLDKWIVILQTMILGSNDTEQCIGLQALSICAGYSKQISFYPSSPCLMLTKGEMRKKILKATLTSRLLNLFNSDDDAIRYCASRALITIDADSKPVFYLYRRCSCLIQVIHNLISLQNVSLTGWSGQLVVSGDIDGL